MPILAGLCPLGCSRITASSRGLFICRMGPNDKVSQGGLPRLPPRITRRRDLHAQRGEGPRRARAGAALVNSPAWHLKFNRLMVSSTTQTGEIVRCDAKIQIADNDYAQRSAYEALYPSSSVRGTRHPFCRTAGARISSSAFGWDDTLLAHSSKST